MIVLTTVLALAQPVPERVAAARDRVDWEAAGAEATALLADYIAVDTVNPPGNERAGVAFLEQVLHAEGIEHEVVELAPGRASLIARVAGNGSEPPLCLLSHVDVVPVEPERWTHDPFHAGIVDGYVWGRGALDMKGMGAIELLSLVWLHRLQVPLRRDVVLLAVADEEGDDRGMLQLVAQWDRIGCSHLINEGGIGLSDALIDGQTLQAISVAEKGILWVRMVAEGRAGHGSTPYPGEAPDRLRDAMAAVSRYKPRVRWDPAMYELLARAGRHHGGVVGAILRSKLLVRTFVRGRLLKTPATAAVLTDTIHLTGMAGAVQPNTVPSQVSATYDCRLLPGTHPDDVLATLRRLTRKVDGIRFEVLLSFEANRSPVDDPVFDALARYAVEGRPSHVAAPILSVGFTDSLFVRPLGVHAYGHVPFTVTPAEAETMHGHDERVSVEAVRDGLRILFSVVVDAAGAAPAAPGSGATPASPAPDR